MELVYLWVEEYKNIKRQGFNFSPQFECTFHDKYKEDGTLEENCKLDIEPREHIENFFGDNINVTAIVGKNGSGKSGILKFLRMLYNSKDGFAIFKKDKDIFYLGDQDKYNILKKYKILDIEQFTQFPLFDYSYTYDKTIDSNLTFPVKQTGNIKGVIVFEDELIRNQENILLNYFNLEKNNQLYIFEKFFQPKTINIYFDPSSIKPKWELTKEKKAKYSKLKDEIIDAMPTQDYIKKLKDILSLLNEYESYQKPPDEEIDFDRKYPNKLDFTPNRPCKLGNDDEDKARQNIWHKDFQDQKSFNEPIKTQKLKQYGSGEELKFNILSLNITELNEELIEIILTSFIPSEFTIDLIDKNEKKLSDLSFGEQQLIFILNQIYSLKNDSVEHEEDGRTCTPDNFIILLDEIDIGFHPDWQKRVISYIVDFLKLIPEKNFHLIFTSHSPFLLSDLPKENVIFLDTDEQGNCKVIDGLKDKKQTFGANIHTLLSDGFFMEDGLMGEFAKGKIEDLIDYLQNDKGLEIKDNKEAQQLLNIIGEPIIKNQLQGMLDSKRLSKLDEIEIIKKQIEVLQNELKKKQDKPDDKN